jgi:hypothetical protein
MENLIILNMSLTKTLNINGLSTDPSKIIDIISKGDDRAPKRQT